ncbi:classical arabinogalactan protein 9-like [Corvus kubaryi]|uniref:classical arabinogalactan protein 9-like n=1 Tax=Corvus kubaryi TaxID=68294 RepID=UPI001C047193|nr:classical arabinogalactan protein 9-like [Corvus kubaryi]
MPESRSQSPAAPPPPRPPPPRSAVPLPSSAVPSPPLPGPIPAPQPPPLGSPDTAQPYPSATQPYPSAQHSLASEAASRWGTDGNDAAPVAGETESPSAGADALNLTQGFACLSTGEGIKWIPAKNVKPYHTSKPADATTPASDPASGSQEASTQT